MPKTEEPDPLIEAYSAPMSYSFCLIASICGCCGKMLGSKSLTKLCRHSEMGACKASTIDTGGHCGWMLANASLVEINILGLTMTI